MKDYIITFIGIVLLAGVFLFDILYPLAFFAYLPFLYLCFQKKYKKIFIMIFSVHIIGLFWIKFLLPWLAVSALLSLYWLGAAYLINIFSKEKKIISNIFTVSLIMVIFEYLHSIGPLGFPVGIAGYTQSYNKYLLQFAQYGSVWLISYIILSVNVAIYYYSENIKRLKLLFGLILTLILIHCIGLDLYSLPIEKNKLVKVALIQPCINYYGNWRREKLDILSNIIKQTKNVSSEKPQIVIWPEGVFKRSIRDDLLVITNLAYVLKSGSYLIAGGNDEKVVNNNLGRHNSAYLFSPGGKMLITYDKNILVPEKEKLYLFFLTPIYKVLDKKFYDPGKYQTIFNTEYGNIGMSICYESLFPAYIRKPVKHGVDFLVNISNDIWSESRLEKIKHFDYAIYRAVENNRYFVRLSNDGKSAVIDPRGNVVSTIPLEKKGELCEIVYFQQKKTFYSRFGDVFVYLLIIIFLFLIHKKERQIC